MKQRRAYFSVAIFLCGIFLSAAAAAQASPAVRYEISLARRGHHLLHVRVSTTLQKPAQDFQLPVWNALYQVRDFAKNVRNVSAKDSTGRSLAVRKLDKTTWRVNGAEHGVLLDYDLYADEPGPFGAQLSDEHAFLNLAEVLMYPVAGRGGRVQASFIDLPSNWRLASGLPSDLEGLRAKVFTAENYDRLVDSPIEAGSFRDFSFQEGGATYRIVVHADPSDYDMNSIAEMLRKIVAAETAWMNDRPFQSYTFIYHFPRGPASGGMEHAYSAAIDVSASRLAQSPLALASVSAHEFFHLWNVKRIRPQSLEPIDYTHENYTTALWFSEGVTSTVADYILLQAGLLDQQRYLERLANQIRTLQNRPAHRTQSAEESSLDAWLEKYDSYWLPQRSVSYYNKGEILGAMLDLAVRNATQNSKSLRDIFQWMNGHYGRPGRFFPDSAGVKEAAEAVTGSNFDWFFQRYVSSTDEIPYDDFLKSVGLQVSRSLKTVPFVGFTVERAFRPLLTILSVEKDSDAARAGLAAGDKILAVNGKSGAEFEATVHSLHVGDKLRVRASTRTGERDLEIKLGGKQEEEFSIVEMEHPTAEQLASRTAWLGPKSKAAEAGQQ